MYKKTVLMSVLFFPLLSITSVKADSPYYAPGHIQGEGGSVEGAIDSGGRVSAVGGKITETIDSAGHISAAGRGIIGSIDSAGHVSTAGGGIIGSIDSAGRVSAAGGGVIGSVPPGNPVLAFQMIQRYNRQKQQQARYNQQYYQQRNAAMAAQNAEMKKEIYSVCQDTYQLCQKPYEEIMACHNFDSKCSEFRNQIVENYAEHAGELHRKDCDAKLMACSNSNNNSLLCRPYWLYCSDYDQDRRKDKHWQGVALPLLSMKPIREELSYQSCSNPGKIVAFDEIPWPIVPGEVKQNGIIGLYLPFSSDGISAGDWHEVGTVDEAGKITPNKRLHSKLRSLVKKIAILGKKNTMSNLMRCGVDGQPTRLGFYDQKTSSILLDNLKGEPATLEAKWAFQKRE